MLKVVFDTNILISALHFKSSIPRKLLETAYGNQFQIVISRQILAELRGVLRVKFGYETYKLNLLEELLISICKLVDPKNRIRVVKDDSDDDKIIECAIEGNAKNVISGDKHLLKIRNFRGIDIITAREFW